MTDDVLLRLPTDEQLSAEDLQVLRSIPPANVFRAVANTTASLQPFVKLAASVLGDSKFDVRLRELAILRVATVTDSHYEWVQHERISRLMGIADDDIARAGAPGPITGDDDVALVLKVAEDITRNVRLSDDLLSELHAQYGTHLSADLIFCVSYFNMVSRVLESMRVPLEEGSIFEG